MKKCKYAKGCQNEVIWYMQFVGEEKPSFYFPGYHIRGFKVIPVCDQHMEEEVNRQHDTAQPSEAIEHVNAADWRNAPVKSDGSQFDKDYPVKSIGSHANR